MSEPGLVRRLPQAVMTALVLLCIVQALFFALTLVWPRPEDVASNPMVRIAVFRARAWEAVALPWVTLALLPGFAFAAWASADWGRRALILLAGACTLACLLLMATEIERVFDGAGSDRPQQVWARLTLHRWATFLLGLAGVVSIRLAQVLGRLD